MPSLDTSLAFLGLSLALGFAPGPDNLFVLVQSAAHGRAAGIRIVLGLCTGLVVHTAAVALGLAAVFAASPAAFDALKLAGCAYLAWLAWQAWRASSAASGETPPPLPPRRMYARGVVMNLTNPKVILFFAAFLPAFVEAARGPVWSQVAWLGLLFIVATLLSFGTITLFAAAFGRRLSRSPAARRAMGRLESLVFAALALRLALARN
jgi:threonine/homoserine/homoserine lactone efflux protein